MIGVNAGSTLRRYRDECGYTQEALAEAVGVSWSSVAQWESGRITPRRKTAERLDVALSAGGELLAAFGYVKQPGAPSAALEQRVTALEGQLRELLTLVQVKALAAEGVERAAVESSRPGRRARRA